MPKNLTQLEEKLKNLPEAPGIYQMLDKDGSILYIGKSKCLKQRVRTYFVPSPKWEKARKMAPFIRDLEYIVTDTHLEAMLLECELIKKIRPYFNVMMKQDSRYAYLKVQRPASTGKLLGVVYQREADSFGPFRSKGRLMDVLETLRRFYPLHKEGRGYDFEFHLLPPPLSTKDREETRTVLLELFQNPKARIQFIKKSEKKMKEASSIQKYETASIYHSLIQDFLYLDRGLNDYESWMHQVCLLTIPAPRGCKLFFIHKGEILDRQMFTEINEDTRSLFLKKCFLNLKESDEKKLQDPQKSNAVNPEPKGAIDYRDIIFAQLPDEPGASLEYVKGFT